MKENCWAAKIQTKSYKLKKENKLKFTQAAFIKYILSFTSSFSHRIYLVVYSNLVQKIPHNNEYTIHAMEIL